MVLLRELWLFKFSGDFCDAFENVEALKFSVICSQSFEILFNSEVVQDFVLLKFIEMCVKTSRDCSGFCLKLVRSSIKIGTRFAD